MTQDEIISDAEYFLKERCNSLVRDVRLCLDNEAAFPAILYCFTTIDLFASLYSGKVKSKGTTERCKKYLKQFTSHDPKKIGLLYKIFRHKLVHLAEPRPLLNWESLVVSWGYVHDDPDKHLYIEMLDTPKQVNLFGKTVTVSGRFWISITTLGEDIKRSVLQNGGYLEQLKQDASRRKKYEKARREIMLPSDTHPEP